MEFKVGDRVRVCDGSADHWRTGVIDSICPRLVSQESEAAFKVGDRVEVSNPNDFHYGCAGVVARIEQGSLYVVELVDGLADAFLKTELRHLPAAHTRGTHPNSLANLAPGQERREGWKETRLRLSERAHGWLRERRQGKGGMSAVVEGLIMEKISEEEKES
jgi:hypothetical protein